LRGLADPPLDEAGREQARRLGTALGPRSPSVVVASPLRRAVETAQPVADQPVWVASLLVSRLVGEHFSGTPYGEHFASSVPE
jgi:broad specificity phosphatase PhoE